MTRLGLYDTRITDDGLQTIGTFEKLEFLWEPPSEVERAAVKERCPHAIASATMTPGRPAKLRRAIAVSRARESREDLRSNTSRRASQLAVNRRRAAANGLLPRHSAVRQPSTVVRLPFTCSQSRRSADFQAPADRWAAPETR